MKEDRQDTTRQHEYRKLIDEFYENNKSIVSEEQYEKTKHDPDYFRALIRKARDLYQDIGKELLLKDKNYHVWEKQFKRRKQN